MFTSISMINKVNRKSSKHANTQKAKIVKEKGEHQMYSSWVNLRKCIKLSLSTDIQDICVKH